MLCGENFGQSVAWLGQDIIDGADTEWLAVSAEADTGYVQLLSATTAGIKVERKMGFDPFVADAGLAINRHCGGALSARRRANATSNAQVAMSCLDHAGLGAAGVRVHTPATRGSVDYTRPAALQANGIYGEAVALLPDLTGDGIGDDLIGWPKYDNSAQDSGRFEITAGLVGTPGIATVVSQTAVPFITLEGTVANGNLGMAVASVGDVDGDGVPDFAVGSPGTRTVRVYSGTSTDNFKQLLMTITADPTNDAYKGFGARVAGIGDVNFDGFADIAISAPEATITVGTTEHPDHRRGAVYIYAGGHP